MCIKTVKWEFMAKNNKFIFEFMMLKTTNLFLTLFLTKKDQKF
jgi:hypothetical protein